MKQICGRQSQTSLCPIHLIFTTRVFRTRRHVGKKFWMAMGITLMSNGMLYLMYIFFIINKKYVKGIFGYLVVRIRLSRNINVSPCLMKIHTFRCETGAISPECSRGRCYMMAVRCPDYVPSLGLTDKIKRNSEHYILGRLSCRSYWKVVSVGSQPPSGFHTRFSIWIYFQRLFLFWRYDQKTAEV